MIGFIVFGLVVGLLARLIVPGRQHMSLGVTLAVGLIGSVVGGIVANILNTGRLFELNIIGGTVAIASAVALVAVADKAGLTRKRDRHGEIDRY